MSGHWYSRANAGLFQLPQPTTQIGIGFDQLPEDIRNSPVLTGSELAKLAGVEQLPDETSVNEYKLTELAEIFLEFEENQQELELQLHRLAGEKIRSGQVTEAWMCLLAFNN
jgi:hypothetical protein